MSRSVDLFIGAEASLTLDDVAGAIGSQSDIRLRAEPDESRWRLEAGEMRAYLSRHRYVDDGELLLSQYPYAVSSRVAAGRPQDSAEAAWLRRVGHRLQEASGWPVLLVLDLQYRDGPGPDGTAVPDGASVPSTGPDGAAASPPGASPAASSAPSPRAGDQA